MSRFISRDPWESDKRLLLMSSLFQEDDCEYCRNKNTKTCEYCTYNKNKPLLTYH